MDKIKVLVAEDLEILREDFAEMIENQKDMMLVGKVSSGFEAIKFVEDNDVDVVLMDIEMEKFHDGIEAAEEILKYYPKIRIVFLTVHEDDETVFSAFEAGAVDYVVKSLPKETILHSIREAFLGRSIIRSEIAEKIRNEFSRMKRNESSLLKVVDIISKLTPSEWEIISMLLLNMKIADIAKARCVEITTIKSQINVLLKKFQKRRTKEIITLIKELNIEYLFQTSN